MSDYTNNYTDNKNARIYIARSNQLIYFKPFLSDLSYSKEHKNVKIQKLFTDISLTDSTKESRKISFHVVANDQAEARENHRKFQVLARMLIPPSGGTSDTPSSYFYIKFTNLLNNFKSYAQTIYTYDEVVNTGLKAFCSNLKYKPDMDLGFFDEGGMFFAKAFTIDLDMKIASVDNRKKTRAQMDSIVKLPKITDRKFYPGSMFGFPVPFKKPGK